MSATPASSLPLLRHLRKTLAVLAILQPDPRAEARVSGALTGAHEVVLRPSWDALEETLGSRSFDACVLDVDHPDRAAASRRVADLRTRFPDLAIVACVESHGIDGLFGLGGLGVDGILFAASLPTKLRGDLDTALSTSRARRIERRLEAQMDGPGTGPAAVAWAMEHAGANPSVDRLATALGHTPRSLREALSAAGLPAPARILLWGRLLLAGARLGDDGRRVEDVAFSLGYATSTSFARAMKVHTGLTPAEVSRRGGMTTVLEALRKRAAEASEESGTEPAAPSTRRTNGSAGAGSRMSRRATLALALVTAGCASAGLAGPSVDAGSIERGLETPPFDQMHVGVLAVDLRSGDTVFSHEAHRKYIPASNQKILVTAAALSLLGPDFRFRTEAWLADGSRPGEADLVIVGSGDPSLSARYWASGTAALDAIADSLGEHGVRRVSGSAIVDVSAWDSTTVGPTWEVEDMLYAYGSTGGAFAIDEGEIEIVVTAGATVGSPAEVAWSPRGTDDFVTSRVVTVASDGSTRIRPHYLPESRRLALDGVVAAGTVDTVSFAIRDPVRQAVATLGRAFERAGIEVGGGWEILWERADAGDCGTVPWAGTESAATGSTSSASSGATGTADGAETGDPDPSDVRPSAPDCTPARQLFALESPPLGDLVAGILEPSQNWMTEQLVHTLGERFAGEGSWEAGMSVVEDYLVEDVGVNPSDLAVRDGSGRSAYNLVTPRALVLVLRAMRAGQHGDTFRNAMAEPGEEDSTLDDRLLDLDGQVFAKTGSISNVNSLSGYLVRRDGREIAFSILTNGSGVSASRVRGAIDDIVRALAR